MFVCGCKLVFAGLLEVSSHPGLTQMWQSTRNASHGFSAWITSEDERNGGEAAAKVSAASSAVLF